VVGAGKRTCKDVTRCGPKLAQRATDFPKRDIVMWAGMIKPSGTGQG